MSTHVSTTINLLGVVSIHTNGFELCMLAGIMFARYKQMCSLLNNKDVDLQSVPNKNCLSILDKSPTTIRMIDYDWQLIDDTLISYANDYNTWIIRSMLII